MLILPLEDARSGMKLAAPVLHPEHPGQEMLRRGYILEEAVLPRLEELGVAAIYVDYPGLEDLDRHLAPNLSPARLNLYQQIRKSIVSSQERACPAVSYNAYYSTTRELITTLMDQGRHSLYLDQMSRISSDAVGHATAVAHLSLLVGLKLELYLIQERKRLPAHHAKEVVNLGIGAMLHDMGKLKLPEALQNCHSADQPTDEAALAEWKNHPALGYELVHDGIEPSAATAILHHHQHFDGTGFPAMRDADGHRKPLEQHRIHIFARIMFVADLYDRLRTLPGSSRPRTNVEILHMMRSKYAKMMDPVVFRAVESTTPPFPPGSRVTLSDKTEAIVTDVTPTDPYRPFVKRVDADGWAMKGSAIDLRESDAPKIESIQGVPVGGLIPKPHPAGKESPHGEPKAPKPGAPTMHHLPI